MGLDKWSIHDSLGALREFCLYCQQTDLPVIVLGPTRYPGQYFPDRVCQKLDHQLRQATTQMGVSFCSIRDCFDSQGNDIYLPDRMHMTVAGHHYVADQLTGVMVPWLAAMKYGS